MTNFGSFTLPLNIPSDTSIDKVITVLEFFKNGGVLRWNSRLIRIGEMKDGGFRLLYKIVDPVLGEEEVWRDMGDIDFYRFAHICKDVNYEKI